MMAIEKFTKQQIAVQIFPEFMPEPGEKAEPIAMGRQTIWGGAGKPPSREVMAAAAKAARQEMMERIRDKKHQERQPRQAKPARNDGFPVLDDDEDGDGQPPSTNEPRFNPNGPRRKKRKNRGGGQGQQAQPGNTPPRHANAGQRPPQGQGGGGGGGVVSPASPIRCAPVSMPWVNAVAATVTAATVLPVRAVAKAAAVVASTPCAPASAASSKARLRHGGLRR